MNDPQKTLFLIAIIPFFLYSVILHEVAHGVVALWNGDPTAKLRGRLTLNPIPHIDPLGTLFFILSYISGFGFGWAKPVPFNPYLLRDMRRGIIAISLAGVTMNILLALGALLVVKGALWFLPLTGIQAGGFIIGGLNLLIHVSVMNIMLALFNLIPIPPLDGSRVLLGLLPKDKAVYLARLEPMGFFILLMFLMAGGFNIVGAGVKNVMEILFAIYGIK